MAADGKQLASLLCENQNNPQEKGNKFAKIRWSLLDCKPLFDLLIFSLKYERFFLASGVTRNSRSQDYKRYSRTKKRRDSNSLRAVPGVRWVTHYFLQIIFASWSPLLCPCYKVNHYKRKSNGLENICWTLIELKWENIIINMALFPENRFNYSSLIRIFRIAQVINDFYFLCM